MTSTSKYVVSRLQSTDLKQYTFSEKLHNVSPWGTGLSKMKWGLQIHWN